MILLAYFLLYFALAFVWRSYRVYAQTGINPLVLPSQDNAYGYVGRAFKIIMLMVAVLVFVNAFLPSYLPYLGPIEVLHNAPIQSLAWLLLALSLVWMLIAQVQMGHSWRIGIDQQNSTKLVSSGLFAVSRNPIFLAMRVNLLGLFLVLPNAISLCLLVAGEILVQVQVRLEEEHLAQLHQENYVAYKAKVRRWV